MEDLHLSTGTLGQKHVSLAAIGKGREKHGKGGAGGHNQRGAKNLVEGKASRENQHDLQTYRRRRSSIRTRGRTKLGWGVKTNYHWI